VDWTAWDHPQLGKVEIGGLMETVRAAKPCPLPSDPYLCPCLSLLLRPVPCDLLIDAHEPDDGDDGTNHGRLPRLNPVREQTALSKSSQVASCSDLTADLRAYIGLHIIYVVGITRSTTLT
jgi:hypothetical protein